jgi:hypothetical protein
MSRATVSCLVLNKRGVWGFHGKIQAKSAAQADRLSEIRFPGRRSFDRMVDQRKSLRTTALCRSVQEGEISEAII